MAKMVRFVSGMIVAASVLVAPGFVQAKPDEAAYIRVAEKAYSDYILPSFQAFNEESKLLEGKVGAFCKKPTAQAHDALKGAFGQLIDRWGAIEYLRFGPMQSKNRLERLLFWPDRKGSALKKVRRAIQAQDPARLKPGALASSSVAFQGLTALEYSLFGAGSESLLKADDAVGTYRCDFAYAIAANIAHTSGELTEAWGPEAFGKTFTQPGKDNPTYREAKEVVAELIKALGTNGQYFNDVKLLPVLGKSVEKAKPKKAMFRRSGSSLIALRSSLAHGRELVEKGDFVSLLDQENKWILDNALFELKNSVWALDNIGKIGLPEAITDEDGRKKFEYLEGVVRRFGELMVAEYSIAADLVIGFNSLDGD